MALFPSHSNSFTGKWLYSDYYGDFYIDSHTLKTTFLNRLSTYPIIGMIAGVARCALAIIHTLGHLFAALVFREKGHLAHAFKGSVEFCCGIIEAIPVVGRIFSLVMNPTGSSFCYYFHGCPCCAIHDRYTFFLIKIYNPKNLDEIDRAVINGGFTTEKNLLDPSGGFIRPLKAK